MTPKKLQYESLWNEIDYDAARLSYEQRACLMAIDEMGGTATAREMADHMGMRLNKQSDRMHLLFDKGFLQRERLYDGTQFRGFQYTLPKYLRSK